MIPINYTIAPFPFGQKIQKNLIFSDKEILDWARPPRPPFGVFLKEDKKQFIFFDASHYLQEFGSPVAGTASNQVPCTSQSVLFQISFEKYHNQGRQSMCTLCITFTHHTNLPQTQA